MLTVHLRTLKISNLQDDGGRKGVGPLCWLLLAWREPLFWKLFGSYLKGIAFRWISNGIPGISGDNQSGQGLVNWGFAKISGNSGLFHFFDTFGGGRAWYDFQGGQAVKVWHSRKQQNKNRNTSMSSPNGLFFSVCLDEDTNINFEVIKSDALFFS